MLVQYLIDDHAYSKSFLRCVLEESFCLWHHSLHCIDHNNSAIRNPAWKRINVFFFWVLQRDDYYHTLMQLWPHQKNSHAQECQKGLTDRICPENLAKSETLARPWYSILVVVHPRECQYSESTRFVVSKQKHYMNQLRSLHTSLSSGQSFSWVCFTSMSINRVFPWWRCPTKATFRISAGWSVSAAKYS